MADRADQNAEAIELLRKLRIGSPVLMLIAAGIAYLFAKDNIKAILAGLFVFLAIMEFFVFGFLVKRLETQR